MKIIHDKLEFLASIKALSILWTVSFASRTKKLILSNRFFKSSLLLTLNSLSRVTLL